MPQVHSKPRHPKPGVYWVACWARQIVYNKGDTWGKYDQDANVGLSIRSKQFKVSELKDYAFALDWKYLGKDGNVDLEQCRNIRFTSQFSCLLPNLLAIDALEAVMTNSVFWCQGENENLVTGLGRTQEMAWKALGSGVSCYIDTFTSFLGHAPILALDNLAAQPKAFISGLDISLQNQILAIKAAKTQLTAVTTDNDLTLF